MKPTIGDNLAEAMLKKEAFLSPDNTGDREEQAREILTMLLGMVGKLAGPEVLTAAYGTFKPGDRAGTLHAIAGRSHLVSALFARLPEDGASFLSIASEALAIKKGDNPLLFARLDGRKSAMRFARARLGAVLWIEYLTGRGMASPEIHGLISYWYAIQGDTVGRWAKQVSSKLGADYVKYFMKIAFVEGATGKDFSWSDDTPYGSEPVPTPWLERLKRDAQAYKATARASKSI